MSIDEVELFRPLILHINEGTFKMQILPLIEKGLLRSPECIMLPLLKFLQQTTIEFLGVEHSFLRSMLQNIRNSNDLIGVQSCECIRTLFRKLHDVETLRFLVSEIFEVYNAKTTLIEHKCRIIKVVLDSVEFFIYSPEICNFTLQTLLKFVSKESNEVLLQLIAISIPRLVDFSQASEMANVSDYFKTNLKNEKQPTSRRAVLMAFPSLCQVARMDCTSIGLSSILGIFNKFVVMTAFEPDLVFVCSSLLALQERDQTAGTV